VGDTGIERAGVIRARRTPHRHPMGAALRKWLAAFARRASARKDEQEWSIANLRDRNVQRDRSPRRGEQSGHPLGEPIRARWTVPANGIGQPTGLVYGSITVPRCSGRRRRPLRPCRSSIPIRPCSPNWQGTRRVRHRLHCSGRLSRSRRVGGRATQSPTGGRSGGGYVWLARLSSFRSSS
jgi:hypothetical protein